MPFEITMPQLSDTMTEGTVVKWHKREGEAVQSGQEIANVETDKATMPMESFESGTLAFIAAPEGTKLKVGALLGVIATSGEDPAEIRKAAQATAPASQAAAGQAPAAGPARPAAHPAAPAQAAAQQASPAKPAESAKPAEPASTANPAAAASTTEPAKPAEADAGRRQRVSPLARRMAEEKGVDLSQVRGSGPGGRVVQRDVAGLASSEAAPASGSAPGSPAPARPATPVVLRGQKQTIPLSKMRTAIATALVRSKQAVPHFYEMIDVDMEAVASLRQQLNKKLEPQNIHLSIMDFVYKAVASALLKHPQLNARFNAEKNEVTQYGDVNLGIAVAIPDGLIVPVLRGVDQMGLADIRVRTLELFDRARAQRLKREEQTEATFTISPLGNYGIRQFTAIINPPEVAILAVGSAEPRPVVHDGQVVAGTMMTATISADHRVVDGAVAAEFLSTLRGMLEEPGMMLA